MTEQRQHRAWMMWSLGILISLTVLYPLSYGPAMGLFAAGYLPGSAFYFYAPVTWIVSISPPPCAELFFQYLRWWAPALHSP